MKLSISSPVSCDRFEEFQSRLGGRSDVVQEGEISEAHRVSVRLAPSNAKT